jgi:hypothetical protein
MLLFYVLTISMLFIFENKTSLVLANSSFDMNIGVPVQMTFSQLSLKMPDLWLLPRPSTCTHRGKTHTCLSLRINVIVIIAYCVIAVLLSVCTWRHSRSLVFQFKRIIIIRIFCLEHQHGHHGFCWVDPWKMSANALFTSK